MRKIIFYVLGLLFCLNVFANADENIAKIKELMEVIQAQQIAIQKQYIEYQERCQNSSRGFGLDYAGLESLNRGLGAENNNYCRRAEYLKEKLELNKNRLLQATLTIERIRSESDE